MGLLDDAMGAALGGGQANSMGDLLGQLGGGDAIKSAGLLAGVMALVQQMGGFEGLIQKFQQQGYGDMVQSWLSNGPNALMGAEQLNRVFGADSMAQVAKQAGMNAQQATDAMGKLLPELVNQFSPQGKLASNHAEMLQAGMDLFTRGLR